MENEIKCQMEGKQQILTFEELKPKNAWTRLIIKTVLIHFLN